MPVVTLTSPFTAAEATWTLRGLSSQTLEAGQLAASLGPAAFPAQLFPETSAPLRALLLGIGDPDAHLRLFQSRASLVADRFESLSLHPNRTLDFREHWATFQLPMPSSPLAIALATGSRLAPSEEWPLLLGGLFTFADGTKAQVIRNERLSRTPPFFPPTFEVPTLSPSGLGLLRAPLPDRWNAARSYLEGHQRAAKGTAVRDLTITEGFLSYRRFGNNGRSLEVTQQVREDEQSLSLSHWFVDGEISRIHQLAAVYDRPPRLSRRERKQGAKPTFYRSQSGLAVLQLNDLPYPVLESWDVLDEAKDHAVTLSREALQFFFFPGALWCVERIPPLTIENFPHELLGYVAAELKRRLSGGNMGALTVIQNPESPLYNFLGSFGDRSRSIDLRLVSDSPEGLPCDWTMVLNGETAIHALPVTRETIEPLEVLLQRHE